MQQNQTNGQDLKRRTACLLTTFLMVAGLSACGPGPGEASSPTGRPNEGVFNLIQRRNEARSGLRQFRDIAELLDNRRFAVSGADPKPLTIAVVTGHIAAVSPGRAFTANNRAEETAETAWDSPNTLWRTFHLKVQVAEVISGKAPDEIVVGLALGGEADPEQVSEDLTQPDRRLLLFLRQDSPVFAYSEGIYSDVEDGALIATVDRAGAIEFPALDDEAATATRGSINTVDDLKAQASQPSTPPVVVDATGRRQAANTDGD